MNGRKALVALAAIGALVFSFIAAIPISAQVYYTGESENGYWDCCHIELTSANTYFNYYDNGTTVWGAENAGYSCRWFSDGWTKDADTGSYNGDGPAAVWDEGECWFHYAPNNGWYHWQKTEYDGHPGWWNAWCDQSGSTVPGGGWSCNGWRSP